MRWLVVLIILLFSIWYVCTPRFVPHVGDSIDDSINLQYITNFLTPDECNYLISISDNKFFPSSVITKGYDNVNNTRTSQSFYLVDDPVGNKIKEKVALMCKVPIENIEGLQIVKYEDGQEFKPHHDFFQPDYKLIRNNQRRYTFFVYLNDVANGGETYFPELDQKFNPQQGNAIFWENCTDEDTCFQASLHQGLAPKGEVKYGLNIWIDFKPV